MVQGPEPASSAHGVDRRPARARSEVAGRAASAKRAAEKQIRGFTRNRSRADEIIRYIEQLKVPSGRGQGENFKLRPWQKAFIRDVYEPHGYNEDGDFGRIVRRAILSVGRKNGKSALISALVLVHLHGPEAIEAGEIYSAANDRAQAAQVFKVCAQIIRADPELMADLKVVDSTKTITYQAMGSKYQAISAEAGTKHGYNPSVVIYDELAQAKSRELYDVLDTSMGARIEPLFLTISTQSNDPEHILSRLIDSGLKDDDPTTVCHLYSVPEDCPDIYDPAVWGLANPALGDFRSLTDLRVIADKAKRWPGEEPKFKNLYLNMRVSAQSSWIAQRTWMERKGKADFEKGEPVYLGLDLSNTRDLTALVMVSAQNGTRVKPFFWKPADTLLEHSARDFGTGNRRYKEWADQELLLTTDGTSIDKAAVALVIAELVSEYRVLGLAYDRWRIADLLREFDGAGLQAYSDKEKGDGLRLVSWGQGFQDMAPALTATEEFIDKGDLVHDGHPILTWCMANAIAVQDASENKKLDKSKARFRIDGAVALAMACGLKSRDRTEEAFDPEDWIASYA